MHSRAFLSEEDDVELLSPAGNLAKLKTAYAFGADAAYIGLERWSMRHNADNFTPADLIEAGKLKKALGQRLYCAMNILFSEDEISEADAFLPSLKDAPFDAYIISDLGLVPLFAKHMPDVELHLSTQASCLNSSAARFYHSLGFKRVILGREATLDDIKRIKDAVPDLQLEAFVHGAMCMAYSGRCLLSAHLAGRSANKGDCAHTCRWRYRFRGELEEAERPGIWYPVEEDHDHTVILSSKDLCMIDHLDELKDAGLDSLKIEGRMKSLMYTALVTRAYRKALDGAADADIYRQDLFDISHREYTTGFFFGHEATDTRPVDEPTSYGYHREYEFLGTFTHQAGPGIWEIDPRGPFRAGRRLEYIAPDVHHLEDDDYQLLDVDMQPVDKLDHCKRGFIKTMLPVQEGWIIRAEASKKTIN